MAHERRTTTLIVALAGAAAVATVAALTFATTYFTGDRGERTVLVKPCGERIFGHVASLARRRGRWEMRFDPAWFTSGVTANTAAAEDGVVAPGEPVPNDNYRIDESHRLLTYFVAPNARITVLTRHGNPSGFGATPITVSQLARLVRGGKPVELFEPLDTGVWIRVHGDTVCSIEQQYQP
jgi:hypothetical protein